MQVLQNFRDDLPLCRVVFLPHGPVHQPGDALVEVRAELLQVFGVSGGSQALPTDPFHCVSENILVVNEIQSIHSALIQCLLFAVLLDANLRH